MPLQFARGLGQFPPERVFELGFVSINTAVILARLLVARLAVYVDPRWIVLENTLRSGDCVQAVVRMRVRNVVLKIDRQTICSLN